MEIVVIGFSSFESVEITFNVLLSKNLTKHAGITCETCVVNKMADGKLPLSFLSVSSSKIGSMQERIV